MTEQELISAYKNCFATDSGRIVLKHLVKAHGVFKADFMEESTHCTAFNQGGRNAVLGILKKIQVDEKLMEKLIKEGEDYAYYGETL